MKAELTARYDLGTHETVVIKYIPWWWRPYTIEYIKEKPRGDWYNRQTGATAHGEEWMMIQQLIRLDENYGLKFESAPKVPTGSPTNLSGVSETEEPETRNSPSQGSGYPD